MKPKRSTAFFASKLAVVSASLFTTCSLVGIAHAVPTIAGGNGNFEATTIGNLTSWGSGLYDGGLSSLDGWTFSGGTNNTFRWIFDSTCPFGPVLGSYSLNLTQPTSSYANVATTTVTGLTAGQGYALSFETAARDGAFGSVTVKVDGTSVGTFDQTVGTTYVTRSFSFTASDTSASVSFEYGSTVNNSGYMLDNVTVIEEPWTPANGIWQGGGTDNNWNTAGNWQGNTIAQGIDKSATFNSGTPVTATVNVNRPIGALLFSGANHTIAAGTGSLTLDGDTLYPTPTVTVSSGITATIEATLNGAEGLLKDGIGTLVLSGVNPYTGITSVANGTLTLQLADRTGNNSIGSFDVASGATLNLDNTNTTLGGANEFYPASFLLTGHGTLSKTNIGSIDFWNGSNLTGFTGTVDVQEGSLRVNNIGTAANMDSATLNIASGATFDIRYNASLSVDKLTGAGTLDQTFDGGSGLSVTVGSNDGSSTFNGVIQNGSGQPLALTKSGTGTFTLAGINTYTGNTTVDAGTLQITNTGSLRFRPTSNGNTNSVSTTGSGTLSYLGTVNLDLSAAVATIGNSWNLFSLTIYSGLTPAAVTSTLGSFSEVTPGTWELPVTGAKWVFTEADGNLAYVNASSPYVNWGAAYGLTAGTEGDDLDNDGLTNFQEFAFGLIPNNGSSVNPITSQLDKTTGQFTYQRLNGSGLTYTIWTSQDLVTWIEDATASANQNVIGTVGQVQTVEATLTGLLPASKLFVQVRAASSP